MAEDAVEEWRDAVKEWRDAVEEWRDAEREMYLAVKEMVYGLGLIFYLSLAANFVCICWFAYKWYKNRQNMNNAAQNLENPDEDRSNNQNMIEPGQNMNNAAQNHENLDDDRNNNQH